MVRGQMEVVNEAVWLGEVRELQGGGIEAFHLLKPCVEATSSPGESVVTTAGRAREKVQAGRVEAKTKMMLTGTPTPNYPMSLHVLMVSLCLASLPGAG